MFARLSIDSPPPLYYIVLKFWGGIFGSGVGSLRSLSVIFGALTIWVGYLFARELLASNADESKPLSFLTGLLLAVNPWLIWSSMQVGNVAFGTFLGLLASYLLIKALRENELRAWLAYVLSLIACLFTHYFFLVVFLAHLGFSGYYILRQKKDWRYPAGSFVLSFLIILPWLLKTFRQFELTNNDFVFMLPFLIVLLSFLLLKISGSRTKKTIIVILIFANLFSYAFYAVGLDAKNNPGMAGATEYINERAGDTDKIFLSTEFLYPGFVYYNGTGIQPKLISETKALNLLISPEYITLENEILKNTQTEINDNVWLVWTREQNQTKPNVPGTWTVVEEIEFGGIAITYYLVK
ncbi:MAG: glycosyltransferase family 39 protein [Candidatus Doudnabacteria bacterium]|nr:glycosyltransferase family 39 protein [Candidatus Doudnabacteria bacterium]